MSDLGFFVTIIMPVTIVTGAWILVKLHERQLEKRRGVIKDE